MRLHCRIFLVSLLVAGVASAVWPASAEKVKLTVSMEVDRDVYLNTLYGEPPQIAVWLEQPKTGKIRTIWVARRAGRRWWKGKVECPVALPYWESRHRHEKSDYKGRGLLKRFIDAVSGATPTGGPFTVEIDLNAGETWDFYVEVNLSADFNAAFPQRRDDGLPDPEVNGQPSVIYKGRIETLPGQKARAVLVGRTDQWEAVDELIVDLEGITTAREIVRRVAASCMKK